MDRQLYSWWKRAYFGLKHCGTDSGPEGQSLVRVQFHWLPQLAKDTMLEQNAAGFRKQLETTRTAPEIENIMAVRASGQPVRSGDIFLIPVSSEDAPELAYALSLLWFFNCIAGLTGTADDLELEENDGLDSISTSLKCCSQWSDREAGYQEEIEARQFLRQRLGFYDSDDDGERSRVKEDITAWLDDIYPAEDRHFMLESW